MKIKLSFIGLVLAAFSATNAYAAVSTGTCDGQRISYATDDASVITSSETFVNMPGMSRTINIPGTTSTCVAVNFSTTASVDFIGGIVVRATRDGAVCNPGSLQLVAGSDEPSESYAFNFVCTGVTPGSHTFRIQWFSGGGFTASSGRRSMIIHHR